MDKGKLIFILSLVFALIILIIFSISRMGGNNNSGQSDFAVPDLVKDKESKNEYNTRISKANLNRNPQNESVNTKDLEFKTYQADSSVSPNSEVLAHISESMKDEQQEKANTRSSTQAASGTKPKKTSTAKPEAKAVETILPAAVSEPIVEAPKTADKPKGGFGVVRSSEGPKKTPSKVVSSIETRFNSVMLEESIVIKENTSVVFILLEDVTVDGITFFKNSYLFGKAKLTNAYFDIRIDEVKNTDGKLVSVRDKNIFIFDEKYSRGFAHEGNLNEAIKDGTGEIAAATSNEYVGGRTGVALKAIDRTISAVSRKKEVSVSLSKGYKVYIKNEKE